MNEQQATRHAIERLAEAEKLSKGAMAEGEPMSEAMAEILSEATDRMARCQTGDSVRDHGRADDLLVETIIRLSYAADTREVEEAAGRLVQCYRGVSPGYA